MLRIRPLPAGASTAVLALLLLGATSPALLLPRDARAAAEAAPAPPLLAEGPQYQACLAQTRTDPKGALQAAEAWEAAGGGDAARHCLGLSLLALGEPDRAAERLEAAASRSRAGAAARAAVFAQAVQAWMMADQPGRAFGAATMGLVLTPQDAELLTDRALALGALNRHREAAEDLDRVLAIEPDRAEALVLRAAAMRRLDRAAEAQRDVDRALAIAPGNAEALLERGIQRRLRGDARGARADWERAIALAPDTATADLARQNLALSEAPPRRR